MCVYIYIYKTLIIYKTLLFYVYAYVHKTPFFWPITSLPKKVNIRVYIYIYIYLPYWGGKFFVHFSKYILGSEYFKC